MLVTVFSKKFFVIMKNIFLFFSPVKKKIHKLFRFFKNTPRKASKYSSIFSAFGKPHRSVTNRSNHRKTQGKREEKTWPPPLLFLCFYPSLPYPSLGGTCCVLKWWKKYGMLLEAKGAEIPLVNFKKEVTWSKDYNDFLCYKLGITIPKERRYERWISTKIKTKWTRINWKSLW